MQICWELQLAPTQLGLKCILNQVNLFFGLRVQSGRCNMYTNNSEVKREESFIGKQIPCVKEMVAWLYRMMCVLTILLTTYSHDQSCICHQPLYDQHLRNGWQPQLCPSIPIAQESHVFSMPTGSSEPALGSACPLPTALMATSDQVGTCVLQFWHFKKIIDS